MTRSLCLTGFVLFLALGSGLGCGSTAACEDDTTECYCMRNPQNCENEPEEATQAMPDVDSALAD